MGKGSNTTTTSTAPNPAAMGAYLNLLGRADTVANKPYQAYTGDLTSPINAQQQQGIAGINGAAGFAQPYIQQAAGFANQAAQPLTQQDIAQYQSPYTQSVVDATSNWFNNQNQQQQQNVLGNAAAQGALGGDRVGVAQANLAAQQTASQAPVIAGLYNQGYQQAVGVAQQQQQNRANAAYSLGNLGVAGQNAALTGANAQVGAGSLQQQNEQQRLNAAYQQFQIQQAFPYQQTQWLAGIDTGVGSQLGGNSSTTAPPPNPWSQVAGLGLAAAGAFLKDGGRVRGFAPGGAADGPYAGVGWIPTRSITLGRGAPPPPNVSAQPQANLTKPMEAFAKGVGRHDWSDGPMDISSSGNGFTPSPIGATFAFNEPSGLGPLYHTGGPVRGFAAGGGPEGPDLEAAEPARGGFAANFDDTFANFARPPKATPANRELALALAQKYDPVDPIVLDSGPPVPRPRPDEAPQLPPNGVAGPFRADEELPEGVLAFGPRNQPPPSDPFRALGPDMGPVNESPPDRPPQKGFGLGYLPPDLKGPLLTAGLAMLASRSPNLGNAIGDAGLAGVQAYSQQKQQALQHEEKRTTQAQQNRRIDLEAKRLDQAADHARKTLAETTRQHDLMADRENNKMIGINEDGFPVYVDSRSGVETVGKTKLQGKAPAGYVRNPDGSMAPVKGGPADPEHVAAVAKAKAPNGGTLPDDTADWLAERVIAGDARALTNLGRGAQGAENIIKVQTLAARKAAEKGMNPNDILARVAEQSGLTAQQRTFGTQVARMAVNSTEAEGAIDLGRNASAAVPRGNWVPVTKAIQAFQSGTSDPKLAAFGAANLAIINTYSRAISPTGTPTVHDKEHAEKLLSTATGPDAYNAVLDMMKKEIAIAHAAPSKAKEEMERIRKGAPAAHAAPAGPNVGDEKTFKGGLIGVWDGKEWKPKGP